MARRPLHFIWILDLSGSMSVGGRIQALNTAIEETLPQLREDSRDHPQAQLLISVLAFANEAVWLQRDPVPVEHFRWRPVQAIPQGLTELGSAIMELIGPMRQMREAGRGFAPVLVLVSDGRPTHVYGPPVEFAMQALLAEPWGAASVRMAVGIGEDADMTSLATFIANSEREPLRATNQTDLVAMIQWASRQASRAASSPAVAAVSPPSSQPVSSGLIWDASTI